MEDGVIKKPEWRGYNEPELYFKIPESPFIIIKLYIKNKNYDNLPLEMLVARPVVVVIRLEASSSSDSKKLVVSNSELSIEDEP